MTERELTIDVVSDVVCPWCRVGKANLDAALAQWAGEQPARPVTVRWHPFFLSADIPPEGVPYHAFMAQKFGSAAVVEGLFAKVIAAGEPTGTAFRFDRIERRPNTLNAHRLIDHFQQQALPAHALAGSLFEAFFMDGQDIGDTAVLTRLAVAHGAPPEAIARYLASDEGADQVMTQATTVARQGIGGVPLFIVAGERALSGAVPAQMLLAALRDFA
jgi:predicted DsbA family dithiol-disulfide isomerase